MRFIHAADLHRERRLCRLDRVTARLRESFPSVLSWTFIVHAMKQLHVVAMHSIMPNFHSREFSMNSVPS